MRWPWPQGHPRYGTDAPDTCEIGHTWLARSAIRTGANTEMKRLMLEHAFEVWQVESVCLHTDARNERSRRAMERIGAQFEGNLRAHRLATNCLPRDSARYSVIAPRVARRAAPPRRPARRAREGGDEVVTGLPTDMGGARAKVRRKPERARYDAAAVHAVLDAAPFCHVATVRDGRPVALPMVHARRGGTLMLHGSAAAGLFRDMRRASPVCVTATLFDGLVLARSARNHSVNYRSVTVHGDATLVTDPDEVLLGMRALIEHVAPGRWEQVRRPEPDRAAGDRAVAGPDRGGLGQGTHRNDESTPSLISACLSGLAKFPPAWSLARRSRAGHLPGSVDPAGRDVVLNSGLRRCQPGG